MSNSGAVLGDLCGVRGRTGAGNLRAWALHGGGVFNEVTFACPGKPLTSLHHPRKGLTGKTRRVWQQQLWQKLCKGVDACRLPEWLVSKEESKRSWWQIEEESKFIQRGPTKILKIVGSMHWCQFLVYELEHLPCRQGKGRKCLPLMLSVCFLAQTNMPSTQGNARAKCFYSRPRCKVFFLKVLLTVPASFFCRQVWLWWSLSAGVLTLCGWKNMRSSCTQ